jgi:hypothetical protein
MRRLALAASLVCATVGAFGVGTATADPVGNKHVTLFHVTCAGVPAFDVLGQGAAGHVLGSNSNAVLLAGTATVFVNGVQVSQSSQEHPGEGTPALTCSAFAEFTDGADTIRIEITNAKIHLTPASG